MNEKMIQTLQPTTDMIPDYEDFLSPWTDPFPSRFGPTRIKTRPRPIFRLSCGAQGTILKPVEVYREAFSLRGVESPGSELWNIFWATIRSKGLTYHAPDKDPGSPGPEKSYSTYAPPPGGPKPPTSPNSWGTRDWLGWPIFKFERTMSFVRTSTWWEFVSVLVSAITGRPFPFARKFDRILWTLPARPRRRTGSGCGHRRVKIPMWPGISSGLQKAAFIATPAGGSSGRGELWNLFDLHLCT